MLADVESARSSGVQTAPAFFINGRRYTGPWDESSLADAMLGSLGHRVQSAAFEFVRWGPASGLLLTLSTLLALGLSNSPLRLQFQAIWDMQVGVRWGASTLALSVVDWVNHGMLTIFFRKWGPRSLRHRSGKPRIPSAKGMRCGW